MQVSESKPVVLYVDDDMDDRILLSEALLKAAPQYHIQTAEDGLSAMDILKQSRKNPPCLVILDLNMPGMSGKEVIKKIRSDEDLSSLKVVVFTTSANPDDKKECAHYGVDMFTKPMSFEDFQKTVRKLITYCELTA